MNLSVQPSIFADLLKASPVVQALLLALLSLSVFSWAIIYNKYLQMKNTRDADWKFEEKFWKISTLQSLYESIDDFATSPMAKVFRSAYNELQKIVEASPNQGGSEASSLNGIDNLERALRKATDIEIGKLEYRLGFLATVGSTSPFIGLLGTVIGIMTSFRDISRAGSASLATVAPGISEALFATAVGLFAAIPAVMAYNHFLNQVQRTEIRLNSFSSDFLNIAKRKFFKD